MINLFKEMKGADNTGRRILQHTQKLRPSMQDVQMKSNKVGNTGKITGADAKNRKMQQETNKQQTNNTQIHTSKQIHKQITKNIQQTNTTNNKQTQDHRTDYK